MPTFLPTLRASKHLDETPAERVCWLWLLALSPPKPAVGAAAAGELVAEATVQLQALLHDESAQGAQGVLALVQLLHAVRSNPNPNTNPNPSPSPT